MSLTTKTLARIPGHDKLTTTEKRLNEEIAKNRAATFDSPITAEDFVAAAKTGADFPEEPHFHNEAIRNERLNTAIRGEMLKDAAKTLQGEKQDLIRKHADDGLDYLRGQLCALMREVLEVDNVLGNIRNAEQVLTADDPAVLSAWRRTGSIIALYAEIRGMQHTLTAPTLGDGQSFKITAVGHIRNSLEQSDYWLTKRRRSVSSRAANDQDEAVRNFDKWLEQGGTAPFKHSTSAIPSTDTNGNPANAWDYLVWLATKATPWVPTSADVIKAWDAANLAVAVTDYKKYRSQEAGRGAYFKVIDRKPLAPYTNGPKRDGEEKARRVKPPSFGESMARELSY